MVEEVVFPVGPLSIIGLGPVVEPLFKTQYADGRRGVASFGARQSEVDVLGGSDHLLGGSTWGALRRCPHCKEGTGQRSEGGR